MNLEQENTDAPRALPWPSKTLYLPAKEAEWNTLLGSVMQPGHLKIRPHVPPAGRAATARLSGGGTIADLHMPALEVVHRPAHLPHSTRRETLVHLVLNGSGELQQANTRFRFQTGDLTFRDAHQPSSIRFSGRDAHLLAMRVPVARWRGDVSSAVHGPLFTPLSFTPLRIPGTHALAQAIHGFVHPLKNGLPNANRIAMTALEQSFVLMLGAAYRQFSPNESANRIQPENPKWQQILDHIETHFFDVLLTPAHCARALRISERYLYRICAEHGEHFSKILLRRRLDACAERLRDPRFARYQIASIAYQCGFTSAAHFSRAFSVRFGVAPRAWRNRTNA